MVFFAYLSSVGKKKSNTTRGGGTRGSRRHGWDMSEQQRKDQEQLKKFSKNAPKKFILVADPDAVELAAFPSEFSALRRGQKDNLGYRIPQVVPGEPVEPRGRPAKEDKRAGAKQKIKPSYRVIRPGEPDIDLGVKGLIQPTDTEDFVRLGDKMDAALETFDRVTKVGGVTYARTFHGESSSLEDVGGGIIQRLNAKKSSLTMRDTIGVSPGLSRALQRMVEDGLIDDAREAIESIVEKLGREYEQLFRGPKTHAKVTSIVPHFTSGHFHVDLWVHATFLAKTKHGVEETEIPIRLWDPKAHCHHGPGPGVVFWNRHLETLGDLGELAKIEPKAAERASVTALMVNQAIDGCKKRAAAANRKQSLKSADDGDYVRKADDFGRDIKIHRIIDDLLISALPAKYVEMGQIEYRAHLIEAYKEGTTGVRMNTPEDLAQVTKLAKRTLERAEAEKKDATELLRSAQIDLETEITWSEREIEESQTDLAWRQLELERAEDANAEAFFSARAAEQISSELVKAASGEFQIAKEKALMEAAPILDRARDREAKVSREEIGMKERILAQNLNEKKLSEKSSALDDRENDAFLRETELIYLEGDATLKNAEIANRESSLMKRESAVEITEYNAVISGLKTAFRQLNPDREPEEMTQAGILTEIKASITRTVAIRLRNVIKWLRPNFKSTAKTLLELDEEVIAVGKDFMKDSIVAGLKDAQRALMGDSEPKMENQDETTLRAAIQEGIVQLKLNADIEVAESLIGRKLGKVIEGGEIPVELVKKEFDRLQGVEKAAKELAETPTKADLKTRAGIALSKLRKLLEIDEPPGGKGGYGS